MYKHAGYYQLVNYYVTALACYQHTTDKVVLKMDEAEYCDHYVASMPPIIWTSAGATYEGLDGMEARLAFQEAKDRISKK